MIGRDSFSTLDIIPLVGHGGAMVGNGVQLRESRVTLAAASSCPSMARVVRLRLTQRRAIDFGTLTTTGCSSN
ncbi:MAG TPA: hypothetical protein VGX23_26110 [Actinocrinis sp.]|nr:hypothetical protein [Actinocrinis sp.]